MEPLSILGAVAGIGQALGGGIANLIRKKREERRELPPPQTVPGEVSLTRQQNREVAQGQSPVAVAPTPELGAAPLPAIANQTQPVEAVPLPWTGAGAPAQQQPTPATQPLLPYDKSRQDYIMKLFMKSKGPFNG